MGLLVSASSLFGVFTVALFAFVKYGMIGCRPEEFAKSLVVPGFESDPFKAVQGKIIIVTGANAGLGYQTALFLAQHKARVIMGCRDASRCNAARQRIMEATKRVPGAIAPDTSLSLDLGSHISVRAFAGKFAEKYGALDVLINNAGVMGLSAKDADGSPPLTTDGLEMQMGVNHFSHFLLTALLFPLLNTGGRVVNHSSGAHKFANKNFLDSDWQFKNTKYDWLTTWTAYANSKASNLLFTYEINDRLQAIGNPKSIISVAVEPGYTNTELQRKSVGEGVFAYLNTVLAMNLPEGSQTQIQAAVGPRVLASNNTVLGPRYGTFGPPSVINTGKYDRLQQQKLWDLSEKLTHEQFVIAVPVVETGTGTVEV